MALSSHDICAQNARFVLFKERAYGESSRRAQSLLKQLKDFKISFQKVCTCPSSFCCAASREILKFK